MDKKQFEKDMEKLFTWKEIFDEFDFEYLGVHDRYMIAWFIAKVGDKLKEKKTQKIHKELTGYLEEKKPQKLILKTALKALSNSDERIKAIVASGRAAQSAYDNIEKLKTSRKLFSSEEISNEIKRSWNNIQKQQKVGIKNNSLNNTILGALEETLSDKIINWKEDDIIPRDFNCIGEESIKEFIKVVEEIVTRRCMGTSANCYEIKKEIKERAGDRFFIQKTKQ